MDWNRVSKRKIGIEKSSLKRNQLTGETGWLCSHTRKKKISLETGNSEFLTT